MPPETTQVQGTLITAGRELHVMPGQKILVVADVAVAVYTATKALPAPKAVGHHEEPAQPVLRLRGRPREHDVTGKPLPLPAPAEEQEEETSQSDMSWPRRTRPGEKRPAPGNRRAVWRERARLMARRLVRIVLQHPEGIRAADVYEQLGKDGEDRWLPRRVLYDLGKKGILRVEVADRGDMRGNTYWPTDAAAARMVGPVEKKVEEPAA